ncbi:MAG TPA: cupin domain-containing protein [Tepidiformaceae bacterium]|nr:cupin domain-containing protein [Tepidiformaceae bacterium]
MKVLRKSDTPETPAVAPIFEGDVTRRDMVSRDDSSQVTVTLVRFLQGAKNKLHVHTADQVLYITEGHGLVGNRDGHHQVEAGDIAHIPAGEPHWHGAQAGHDMAHLSILPPCDTSIVEE